MFQDKRVQSSLKLLRMSSKMLSPSLPGRLNKIQNNTKYSQLHPTPTHQANKQNEAIWNSLFYIICSWIISLLAFIIYWVNQCACPKSLNYWTGNDNKRENPYFWISELPEDLWLNEPPLDWETSAEVSPSSPGIVEPLWWPGTWNFHNFLSKCGGIYWRLGRVWSCACLN